MADFRKFKGQNIKYSHRDPQKTHNLHYNDIFWRILLKTIQGVWAVAGYKNPLSKKRT